MADQPVKLPVDLIQRLDSLAQNIVLQVPDAARGGVSRASVARMALQRGIESMEIDYSQKVPVLAPGQLYRLQASRDGTMIPWYIRAVADGPQMPQPLDAVELTRLVNEPGAYRDLPGSVLQAIFAWAGTVDGWPDRGPKPLYVVPLA
jgi:hypothetical protein